MAKGALQVRWNKRPRDGGDPGLGKVIPKWNYISTRLECRLGEDLKMGTEERGREGEIESKALEDRIGS